MELSGAVVTVTGASAGIGEMTAAAMARQGARVVIAARRLERLERITEVIRAHGGDAVPVRCDVTDLEQVRRLRATAEEAFGRCDVLVNNAGIPDAGPFETSPIEETARVVNVNLLGVLACTKEFLPLVPSGGHIVNVASLAGRFAAPGSAVYSATKHAVVAFSESLHAELAPRGIAVTAINPGWVRTEGFPQTGLPSWAVMKPARIAEAIVKVVREARAPEYSIPRFLATFQLLRMLAPPIYHRGLRAASARSRLRPSR